MKKHWTILMLPALLLTCLPRRLAAVPDEDTAQILEIAMRQTEQEAGNVKIIPVAG